MTRYQSILAYDGTEFHGFQRLPRGRRTVQGELERALRRLGWRGRSVLAAGRTDSGVHARGQVAAFDLEWRRTEADLQRALNALLPADMAAWSVSRAAPGFHPRYDARRRLYQYSVRAAEVGDPLQDRYAWRVWPAPDRRWLRSLARRLKGRRDFGAFGRPPGATGTTVRRVFRASWQTDTGQGRWVFTIEADAFLFHMVRRLVGAMVAVAQGRIEPEEFLAALKDPRRKWIGRPAPPQGLCLVRVSYA
jgi:tRNA pseudouridine38-40 synthase